MVRTHRSAGAFAFGARIGGFEDLSTLCPEDLIETCRVLGVAVSKHEIDSSLVRLLVAQYLNVSAPQAYSLVRSGDLPAMKIGGRGVWRVDRRQLDAYIDRIHEETRKWAEEHPLGKDREE